MTKLRLSPHKATAISNGVFLICLGLLFYTGAWWPGILLALWATLMVRQYFTGRIWDAVITTIVLVGLFVINFFNFPTQAIVPILFIIGGIYIIFREGFFPADSNGEDMAEEIREDADID